MIATSLQINPGVARADLDPEALERGIRALLGSYQKTRSALTAWFVVHYAQALCHHPDFEGNDEDRCAWRRLAQQWRWLAQVPAVGFRNAAEDLV